MAPRRCPICGAANATCAPVGAPGASVTVVDGDAPNKKRTPAKNKKRTPERNK